MIYDTGTGIALTLNRGGGKWLTLISLGFMSGISNGIKRFIHNNVRFSGFDVYWIQTNRLADKQSINRYRYKSTAFCLVYSVFVLAVQLEWKQNAPKQNVQ